MRRRHLGLLALAAPATARAAGQELRAADGVQVSADLVPAGTPRRRGTILLFHQAGSNRGEYATIAPELARRGFDTLALDQRSGGDGWGRRNETATRFGRDPGYLGALPDLQAALDWARQREPGGRILLWGSSYSASLGFLLASAPGVSALLAFSPGEYFSGVSVRGAAERVRCPVFVTSASDAGEEAAAARLLAACKGEPKRQFRAAQGLHGSSTLRPDRNPRGATAVWAAVDGFLGEVAG